MKLTTVPTFVPLTLTIETVGEANLMRAFIGALRGSVAQQFEPAINSSRLDSLYNELQKYDGDKMPLKFNSITLQGESK